MRHRLLLAGPLGAAVLALAPVAAAQDPFTFDLFASRSDSLPGKPYFGGIALARYEGPLGLRLGGALHIRDVSNDGARQAPQPLAYCRYGYCQHAYYSGYPYAGWPNYEVAAWNADLDLIFAPLRPVPVARLLLLGFSPYGFVGIGGAGVHLHDAHDANLLTWSLGLGVQHDLIGPAGVIAEARLRRAFNDDSMFAAGLRRGVEWRLGLSVGFGGHERRHRRARRGGVPVEELPVARAEAVDDATRAERVLRSAGDLVGVRYAYGGDTPESGFDAAGFVRWVYRPQGIRLPRTARAMARVGEDVSLRVGSLRPGDLLFFADDGSTINHVAIYAGHDRIIHSSASGGGVRYDALGEGARGRWFADHLVAARRVIGAGGDERDDGWRGDRPDDVDLDPPDHAPRAGRPPR